MLEAVVSKAEDLARLGKFHLLQTSVFDGAGIRGYIIVISIGAGIDAASENRGLLRDAVRRIIQMLRALFHSTGALADGAICCRVSTTALTAADQPSETIILILPLILV